MEHSISSNTHKISLKDLISCMHLIKVVPPGTEFENIMGKMQKLIWTNIPLNI